MAHQRMSSTGSRRPGHARRFPARLMSVVLAAVMLTVAPVGARAAIGDNTQTGTVSAFTGVQPQDVAFTPDGNTAYVVDPGSNAVSVICVAACPGGIAPNTQTTTVSGFSGVSPRAVAITPDGKIAYVTNSTSNTVSVIDVIHNTEIGTVASFTGLSPQGVAFTPDGNTAYVADAGSNAVSVICVANCNLVASNTQLGTVSGFTVTSPVAVALTPDGTTAYVTGRFSPVSVICVTDCPAGVAPNTQTGTVSGNTGNAPSDVAFTPDGKTAYITDPVSRTVYVVDVTRNAQAGTVSGFTASGIPPQRVAFTQDGKTAYVTAFGLDGSTPVSSEVAVICAADCPTGVAPNTQTGTVSGFTGLGPQGVAFAPNGATAYVANGMSNSVSVIHVRSDATSPAGHAVPANGAMLLMPFGR